MSKFTHKELGRWNRVLGPSVIECLNPNDGQSSDPDDKSRYQYTTVNGVLLRRHLPPISLGDKWKDIGTPAWEQIPVPDWPLIRDWLAWAEVWFGIEPEAFDRMLYGSGKNAAYLAEQSSPMSMPVWRKSRIEICNSYWPQTMPCPHCQSWIVWAEAGYVPGYRICSGCHRHWRMTMDSNSAKWMFVRANHRPFWPYGATQ